MQAFYSDKKIELRFDPLSIKNRQLIDLEERHAGADISAKHFVEYLFDNKETLLTKNRVERQGGAKGVVKLAYIFERIHQDTYVKSYTK